MKTLRQLRTQLAAGEFNLSDHASGRFEQRRVNRRDIQESGANAEIVEDYPSDKFTPSRLLLGFTETGRPLHILVSVEDTPLVKIITVYEPDPARWRNHRERIQ